MRINRIIPILGAAICIVGKVVLAAGATYSIEELRNGLTMRSQMTSSTGLQYERLLYHVAKAEDRMDTSLRRAPYAKSHFMARASASKIRFDYTGYVSHDSNKIHNVSHNAWDGTRNTAFTEWPGSSLPVSGTLGAKRSFTFEAGHHLTILEKQVLDIDSPLAELLKTNKWKIVGQEVIGGYPAVHITGFVGGDALELHAWIAAEHDFAPVQYKLVTRMPNVKDMTLTMTDVVLAKRDGMWVYKNVRILAHNPNVIETIGVMDYNISKTIIGEEYSDKLFRLTFPPGCRVLDKVTNIGYIAEAGGKLRSLGLIHEGEYLDFETDHMPDDAPMIATTGTEKERKQDNKHSKVILDNEMNSNETNCRKIGWVIPALLGGVAILLIGIFGIIYHFRRRIRHEQ